MSKIEKGSAKEYVKPKKSFGQNFLQNPQLCSKIVQSADLNHDDLVLEIGPGMGAITKILLSRVKNIVLMEMDHECIDYLIKNFGFVVEKTSVCNNALDCYKIVHRVYSDSNTNNSNESKPVEEFDKKNTPTAIHNNKSFLQANRWTKQDTNKIVNHHTTLLKDDQNVSRMLESRLENEGLSLVDGTKFFVGVNQSVQYNYGKIINNAEVNLKNELLNGLTEQDLSQANDTSLLEWSVNILLVHGDALKVEISDIIENFNLIYNTSFASIKIVANLPYNIATMLMYNWCCDSYSQIQSATIMLQKEVAKRAVAKHNSKEYGKLSVIIQKLFNAQILFDISPGNFYPQPKVVSSILKLQNQNVPMKKDRIILFSDFLTLFFSQRRKKLSNVLGSNIGNVFLQLRGKKIEDILDTKILQRRPEENTTEEIYEIFSLLANE